MILQPILTEKSLADAKSGFYTFWVDPFLTKGQIKAFIGRVFKVHVKSVRTINYKGGTRKNFRGRMQRVLAKKKALVALAKDEKIEIFEGKKS
jgi:large subunit ribosomal protein L23